MATPTLRALRAHFGPQAKLVGILRPYLAPVFAGLPWLDEYLFYERGRGAPANRPYQLWKELRRRQFDKLLLLTNSLSTAALAWFSGSVERIGYDRYARGCLLTHRLIPPREGRTLVPISPVDYYLQLAETLGCRQLSRQVELATTPAEEQAAGLVWQKLCLDQGRPVVAFNTGGAYGAAKHWPVHSFVTLARQLIERQDVSVLILCGPSERETAAEIVRGAAHPRVRSLADERLSVGLTKACVRRSSVLVSTDSGPRHFAAAFRLPTVALFGPTDPRWSVNYNAREVVLRLDLPCSPCAKRVCPLVHHDCMQKLAVGKVAEAVMLLLDSDPQSAAA